MRRHKGEMNKERSNGPNWGFPLLKMTQPHGHRNIVRTYSLDPHPRQSCYNGRIDRGKLTILNGIKVLHTWVCQSCSFSSRAEIPHAANKKFADTAWNSDALLCWRATASNVFVLLEVDTIEVDVHGKAAEGSDKGAPTCLGSPHLHAAVSTVIMWRAWCCHNHLPHEEILLVEQPHQVGVVGSLW